MAKVFKHSHFKADMHGHGGNKRTAQINELLHTAGIKFEEVNFDEYEPAPNHIQSFLKGSSVLKYLSLGIKSTYAIGRYLLKFESFIKNCKPDLFIWESTSGYYLLLAEVLRKHQIPFIAIPHNIESLVIGNESAFSKQKSPSWFKEEIAFLKLANKVFTISREESWLLSIYGLSSAYLPYSPPQPLMEHFLQVKEKRKARKYLVAEKINLFLLGTFHNPPTYKGYLAIIGALSNLEFVQLKVAGFGSEQLKTPALAANIEVLGTLSFNELLETVEQADYALIHQEPSSGSLTRIPELLACGLPIIANDSASRSFYNYPGVVTYHDVDGLINLLSQQNPHLTSALRPVSEEENFKNCIRNLQSER
ncbi:hypothetical protein [Pedobacter frigidisoli]|uniref:hypothetical protein n=1 Tax=Pedobacter frigidisoli TaxID=2530455 RepID=UPI00292E9EC4|nr:hypothetical protein [Pedobacter frigidisoli]